MRSPVPSSPLAVLIPFAWFDNSIDSLLMENLNISSGLLISGTVSLHLSFAYLVRFLAVSINTVEAALGQDKAGHG